MGEQNKVKVIDSMVMPDIKPHATEPVSDTKKPTKQSDKSAKPAKNPSEPRFSRPKAALLAVGVALLVGAAGGFLIWLTGRKDVEYCTVEYDANGGSEIASTRLVCGKRLVPPADPTREGFDFKEWVFEGLAFNFDATPVTKDLLLVARWRPAEGTEAVTITFNSNGGTPVEEQKVQKGQSATAPLQNPAREGYTFAGWFLGDNAYDFATPVNTDIALTAHWALVPVATPPQTPAPQPETPAEQPIAVTALSVQSGTVDVEKTATFDITVQPANAKYDLALENKNLDLVTCSVDGAKILCTGTAAGTATIVVTDKLTNVSTSFTVKSKIGVESVTINAGTTLEITEGATTNLVATVNPGTATNPKIDWSSSDDSIISVDANGTVTAKGAIGTSAIITATSEDNSSAKASITISIVAAPATPGDGEEQSGEGDKEQEESNQSEGTA